MTLDREPKKRSRKVDCATGLVSGGVFLLEGLFKDRPWLDGLPGKRSFQQPFRTSSCA
jgi:hypothetical protein